MTKSGNSNTKAKAMAASQKLSPTVMTTINRKVRKSKPTTSSVSDSSTRSSIQNESTASPVLVEAADPIIQSFQSSSTSIPTEAVDTTVVADTTVFVHNNTYTAANSTANSNNTFIALEESSILFPLIQVCNNVSEFLSDVMTMHKLRKLSELDQFKLNDDSRLALRCTHVGCRENKGKKTRKDKPSKVRSRTQYFCEYCSGIGHKQKTREELIETKQLAMFCNQGLKCCYTKHITEVSSHCMIEMLDSINIRRPS